LPLLAGLLGLGSATLALTLAPYRWAFVALALASLAAGFRRNVLQKPVWAARLIYWTGVALTLVTMLRWGWWER
jgi:hypothetical protein